MIGQLLIKTSRLLFPAWVADQLYPLLTLVLAHFPYHLDRIYFVNALSTPLHCPHLTHVDRTNKERTPSIFVLPPILFSGPRHEIYFVHLLSFPSQIAAETNAFGFVDD